MIRPRMPLRRAVDLGSHAVASILSGTITDIEVATPSGKAPLAWGDMLWVREAHRWRGNMYGSPVPEEYATEPGELDWSCAEIEWDMVVGDGERNSWEATFPDDFMYGKPFAYEEVDTGEEGVRGYLSERLPSREMPRWASRLTLVVNGVETHPRGRVVYRFEAIERNVDLVAGAILSLPGSMRLP